MLLIWIYLTLTQCGELMWFDSGELALAAHTWGIGHPPGQPMYAILSALTTLTPNPLWSLNQISVLATTLTVIPLCSLRRFIYQDDRPHEGLTLLDVCLVLGWVLLYPVWDQATRIEVYALGNLLALGSLAKLLSIPKRKRDLLIAGILLGLCASTQAIFALGCGVASVPRLLSCMRADQWGLLIRYSVGVLLGFFLPHLYLCWAVLDSSGFVWGNWASVRDVLQYFGGADYLLNVHRWSFAPGNILEYLKWLSLYGGGLWLFFALIGVLSIRCFSLAWTLGAMSFVGVFPFTYQMYWPEIPDFSGYLLPFFSCSFLLVLSGFQRYLSSHRYSTTLILAITLILSISLGERSPLSRSRASHDLPLAMAESWLHDLPQDSMLFVESDHWVFPLMYAQAVKGSRLDVLVFNVGFARSTWYWQWLKRIHPSMPSLEVLERQRGSIPRLSALAQSRNAVYAETASLARALSVGTLWQQSQSCLSSFGYSVACQAPLPLPKPEDLRAWANNAAHRDPLTERVLARVGGQLLSAAWSEKLTRKGIELAYASLGEEAAITSDLTPLWWPIPKEVWQTLNHGLIGNPIGLRALLNVLINDQIRPSSSP